MDMEEPWAIAIAVTLAMIVLHLTIVPLAWLAAQIADLATELRARRGRRSVKGSQSYGG